MAECSHHDKERSAVSSTALFVALVRSLEAKKPPGTALFYDPFAVDMVGDIRDADSNVKKVGKSLFEERQGLLDGVAMRTRKIDDELKLAINSLEYEQICVLGAGVDCRPWRLHMEKPDLVRAGVSISTDLSSIKYFEVDFPEIFSFKNSKLNGVESPFDYVAVNADLSLSDWPQKLVDAGFNPNKKTVWLLEGLTGYLTENELHKLFEVISNELSASGSKMIATFLTPSCSSFTISLHRFIPDDPRPIVEAYGWQGPIFKIVDIASELGVEIRDPSMNDYCITAVTLIR